MLAPLMAMRKKAISTQVTWNWANQVTASPLG